MSVKSKSIQSTEAIQLHTESFGMHSKIACVLIAGAMAPGRFWTDEFCQELSLQGCLVIRYDHRDIGLSSSVDWKTAPYTLADLAADAIAILDAYGCEAAYFIGHSMGGHICQQIALDYPNRVIGFAAISSGPIGGTADTDRPLSDLEKATLDKTWEIFLSRKDSNDFEEKVDGFLKIWKYLNASIPFDEEIARAYTIDLLTRTTHAIQAGNTHELVMRGLYESLPQQRNLIERIKTPALIIHGEQDPLSLSRDGMALARAISGSKLLMIPGMGHMIFNRNLEAEIAEMIQNHQNSIDTRHLKKKHQWSQAEIIRAMEENMLFQMTYFAKHAPSLEIVPLTDVTVVKSDIPDDTFNYVLAAQFSEGNASARVADILKLFKASDLPFSWWVGQNDSPKNLSEFLLQQGLSLKEENIGMYLRINDFQLDFIETPLLFEKVATVSQLKDFSNVIVKIGGNLEAFEKIYNKLSPNAYQYGTEDFEMYVGYLNSEPVISGILVFHADVAGIYYVATIPSQRKKGFGTAMMKYLLLQASDLGFHIATLQASKDGKALYERLGFKACTLFREYTNHLKADAHV